MKSALGRLMRLPASSSSSRRGRRCKPLLGERLEARQLLSADPFLKASGTVLRDGHGTGDMVVLAGTNLGGWLLSESWMTLRDSSGLPDDYSARQTLINRFGAATADSLIDAYENAWITTRDLDNIKALGMNVVRLPFWYRNLQDESGVWRADAFERMDWLVTNAWARGIYTILDLHGAPGGQSTADHTGRVRSTAEPWLRKAIAEYQLAVPPDEWAISLARVELGRDLNALGRRPEAEAELLAAAHGLESANEYTYAASALGAFYTAWDQREPGKGYDAKAKHWFLQSVKFYLRPLPGEGEAKEKPPIPDDTQKQQK